MVCAASRESETTRALSEISREGRQALFKHTYTLQTQDQGPAVGISYILPALGGAGGRRRLNPGGALRGRLLVALVTSRLAISFEGVIRNFPWVSK